MASTIVQLKSAILADARQILCPFDKRECISLKQAAAIAGKSESTMRGWCEEHGLGRRVGGGPWMVSKVALAMFLDGDVKALRAYHAGERTGDIVAPYFRRSRVLDQPSVGGDLASQPTEKSTNLSEQPACRLSQ